MLTLHHLNNSRSQRILWLLEELELDYTIQRYERDQVTNLAPPELEAIHPLGKSPVLSDDANTVIESGAIIDYLLRIVVPDIAGYDKVYKELISSADFADVSANFAMEEIKSTTRLPLHYLP